MFRSLTKNAAKKQEWFTLSGADSKTLQNLFKVSYSRPPGANVKETNLYICNLGPSASEERLDELFGEFGTILTRHGLFESFSCVNRKWSKEPRFYLLHAKISLLFICAKRTLKLYKHNASMDYAHECPLSTWSELKLSVEERAARPVLWAVPGNRIREVRPDGGRLEGDRGDERQVGAGLPCADRGQHTASMLLPHQTFE